MIIAIASGGGHLAELLKILDKLKLDNRSILILTNRVELVPENYRCSYITNPHNRINWLLQNIFQALKYSWKYRKQNIILLSTGAGICVPLFILKRGGLKIYIESMACVVKQSRTARILKYFNTDIYRGEW